MDNYLLYVGFGVGGLGPERIKKIFIDNNHKLDLCDDITNVDLYIYTGIIFPGGSSHKQKRGLGTQNIERIKKYINDGGKYIGICAGAYLGSNSRTGISLLNDVYIRKNNRRRGGGICKVFVLSNKIINMRYHNGPVFKYTDDLFDHIKGLYINEVGRKNGYMTHQIAIIDKKVYNGRVILCGPHPEQTDKLETFVYEMITK